MIDTLTITFAGLNYQLQSIDAYTNESAWKRAELHIPTVHSSASLFLTGEFTDDRASLETTATYEFDARKSLLRILFCESKNEEYIKVSTNVVIGISNEMISSVFVSDLIIR